MQQPERCVSWQPVPPPWDRYMVLNVERLEQRALVEGTPVAVTVVASDVEQRTDPHQVVIRTWRISFHHVTAYRCDPIEQPPSLPKRVFPDHWFEGGDIATWEVVQSQWLPEAISRLYSHPESIHHYVIASSYTVYDIAAQTWTVEELGTP